MEFEELKSKILVVYSLVSTMFVNIKARRRIVVVHQCVSHELFGLIILVLRLPKELHTFVFKSLLLFLIIHSCDYHSFELKICKNSRISLRMTKSVNLPSYFWLISVKFSFKKLKTHSHVLYNILIKWCCFIMH